ncbi:MBL fold metallo-hydrolase [Nocardioides sp.]|uniref:MBL fold metallo-hydrolase n=1 Tax=Nocardioides sp. TaxID=35761 RepID=UPI002D7E4345|nr:MBL fold metallo-hydrolase [Nocardioides sp.]HET8961699.1 MBL fold metallo-hydrolase [Nocardioides sp.]
MTGQLSIAWLGHSTVMLEIDGVRLLSDPLLMRHAGVLRRRFPKPAPDLWRDPDAVLVSHLHHDHAEVSSLRMLPPVPVLTAEENAVWLRRKGLPGAALVDGWTRVGDGQVEVRLTEALHHHRPMPHRPNAANGHLVRGAELSVWLVGDTSLYPEMAEIPDLLGRRLDVIAVPIAGWGPRLSPGHLGPDEAVTACVRSGARWALPVHWGTLHPPMPRLLGAGWMDRPYAQFVRALRREAPDCRLVELMPGDVWRGED